MRVAGFDHLLSYRAQTAPDAPALYYEHKGERRVCTYQELFAAARARARELRRSHKSALGVLCDGSLACVITLFGSVLAGLQTVLLDENAPDSVLLEQMAYTDVDAVWSGDRELAASLTARLETGGDAAAPGRLLFFTSGTTQRSKAVVLTDDSLCQSAWNGSAKLPLKSGDVLLCILPLNHVFGFVCGLLWGLHCGAAVALGRGARHYADDCAFYRPTAVSVVPLLLSFLLQHRLFNPELRLILAGAGDCPAPLLDAARAQGVRVCFGYGLTETSSGVAISVDGDSAMEICPDDAVTLAEDGEILVYSPTCLMQGYYKRPEDTAAALEGGVLHTGDLGYFNAEGRLRVTGRKKETLVLPDGTKLFLPEYEAELLGVLGKADLAVVLLEGRPTLVYAGQGSERALYDKLRPLMSTKPRGQQIARIILLSEPLPRTATGKIKRWELQQKVSQL